jgi:hypothetical protein
VCVEGTCGDIRSEFSPPDKRLDGRKGDGNMKRGSKGARETGKEGRNQKVEIKIRTIPLWSAGSSYFVF